LTWTGCTKELNPRDDTVQDTDTDTDTDPWAVDCSADYTMNTPDAATCVTRSISCGETILGSTVGGSTGYGSETYIVTYACAGQWGFDVDYSAPERVFNFYMPAGQHADIELYAPCGDMRLTALFVPSDACPADAAACSSPTMSNTQGDTQTLISEFGHATQDREFQFVVDGISGDTGNFRLKVDCY